MDYCDYNGFSLLRMGLPDKLGWMSEEGKFRFNASINIAILFTIIGGAFALWTTVVQKYDAVDTKIGIMQESISKMEEHSNALTALDKRVDSQAQQIVSDENRELILESKVDALTSLLNQFMGTIRSNHASAPAPPAPTPSPEH
jgi:hypothetical protein